VIRVYDEAGNVIETLAERRDELRFDFYLLAARTADSSSTKAVNLSSARTTKRSRHRDARQQ
jgi:hypothetical protein